MEGTGNSHEEGESSNGRVEDPSETREEEKDDAVARARVVLALDG
jgi:hypothetical protein